MQNLFKLAVIGLALNAFGAQAAVADFEDISLAPNSYYFPEASTPFTSGNATFEYNYYDYGFGSYSWDGFVYSNQLDTTTAGFENQYSAYAASVSNYGLAYYSAYNGTSPTINFDAPVTLSSASFTNTTYAALSMLEGDSFAKKFGGISGDDQDWFKLIITGHDAAGAITGNVDFYLADYRFADNSQDYIVKDWTSVNLAALGQVSALTFSVASSDNHPIYGMNTPAYFAIDNIMTATPVPEPSQLLTLTLGLAAISLITRRRKQ